MPSFILSDVDFGVFSPVIFSAAIPPKTPPATGMRPKMDNLPVSLKISFAFKSSFLENKVSKSSSAPWFELFFNFKTSFVSLRLNIPSFDLFSTVFAFLLMLLFFKNLSTACELLFKISAGFLTFTKP